MFDWNKYHDEMLKRNHKYILIFFLLWVVFTVGFGVALAHVQGVAWLVAGGAAYLLACFGFRDMGRYWNQKETYFYKTKLLKECIDEFVKKQGLEKEFNEFAGGEATKK